MAYLAHSANAAGRPQTLAEHLRRTAEIAASFASSFGASDEARLAGLLHDLGKYGDLFQLRLRGEAHGVDHWSAGAFLACQRCKNVAVALAAQGHHTGLQSLVSLQDLARHGLADGPARDLWAPDADPDVLRERLLGDGLSLPVPPSTLYGPRLRDTASAMLDVRMLFSALVDADFLDTEAHFAEGPPIQPGEADGPPLRPSEALAILLDHLTRLAADSSASRAVNGIRADLLEACLTAARQTQGLWTLSAPTGAGKTLATLAFALQHAVVHGLRRIVVVIPYLSIIEQTAETYRAILSSHFGEGYVREQHSLSGTRREPAQGAGSDLDGDSEEHRLARGGADNWDAPVVITTSVQMLESLFSNRPSACRKLHRLAGSVILFDEVQTLPDHLAIPTLATLSWLAERYGTTVVFSTATQPAFADLDQHVRRLGDSGWQPQEIVPAERGLFERARRTHVRWPDLDRPAPWTEIAGELSGLPQALCIVNVKRHARELHALLSQRVDGDCFHLSTAMCPAHRSAVLELVRGRLARRGETCRLVSTQCVEAGVDLDFPVVYRALGPLESIAQAAGRCNRSGRLAEKGEVRVFVPEDPSLPSGAYGQATSVTRVMLNQRGPKRMDIDDPGMFAEYYRLLYAMARPEQKCPELWKAIKGQDFAKVAGIYRLIEQDSINVLVPYDPPAFAELVAEARAHGLSAAWIRHARPHTVSVFRPKETDHIWEVLESVRARRRGPRDDWFICLRPDVYDQSLGLIPPDAPPVWLL